MIIEASVRKQKDESPKTKGSILILIGAIAMLEDREEDFLA